MSGSLQQISTVIIAVNEEECIAKAIRSCLPFSDEIVLIDSGSRDATVQMAKHLGCSVYFHEWMGYAIQRNFGAEKARYDWIFFIDADEVVDEQLTQSLLHWKQQPQLEMKAFAAWRIGDFWGTWLDTRPESHTRLYNKTVYQIKAVLVHEGPNVAQEQIIRLPGVIWHYGFRDVSDLISRFNRYTDLDAQQSHRMGSRFNWARLLLKPPAKFLQQYLWYGMHRQGLAGFTLSILWSYYIFLKEIKLYDLDWQAAHPSAIANPSVNSRVNTEVLVK